MGAGVNNKAPLSGGDFRDIDLWPLSFHTVEVGKIVKKRRNSKSADSVADSSLPPSVGKLSLRRSSQPCARRSRRRLGNASHAGCGALPAPNFRCTEMH